ncbi:MAG TPA: hypothetical protein VFH47_01365, partial [Candidatus Thermoplasmatota archaeon]|nr:hypothetical protein [Candidatus Thermoplasmatota archaeon]
MPAVEVPVVPRKPWGFACLAMNVLLPGTGTLVAAGNQESRKHLAIGIVQLALFWLVLPWLWS